MGILSGNPHHEPLHYGEVFGVWSHVFASKGMVACYQTFVNHTGDPELKELIEEAIDSMKEEIRETEELLKANGVGLPPTPPERPAADLESIPVGARYMDQEISAAISKDMAQGLIACSQVIGQCIREDVAALYLKYHTSKAQLGARFLRLSKEKGWLIPPPLHLTGTDEK